MTVKARPVPAGATIFVVTHPNRDSHYGVEFSASAARRAVTEARRFECGVDPAPSWAWLAGIHAAAYSTTNLGIPETVLAQGRDTVANWVLDNF